MPAEKRCTCLKSIDILLNKTENTKLKFDWFTFHNLLCYLGIVLVIKPEKIYEQ